MITRAAVASLFLLLNAQTALAAGPQTAGIPGRPWAEIQGGVHDPIGHCYDGALAVGPAGRAILGWRFSRAFSAEMSVLRTVSAATKPGTNPVDVTEWSVDARWFPKRFDVVEPNLLVGWSPDSSIRYSHQSATYAGNSGDVGVGARFRGSKSFYMSTDLRYRLVRYSRGHVKDQTTGAQVDAKVGKDLEGDAVAIFVGAGFYL